jgi:hypothetical protein
MYTLRQLDRFEITVKHLVVFNFKSLRDVTYEIWDFHGGGISDCGLEGCDTV